MGGSQQRFTLAELRDKPVPPAGTKPEYVNAYAYVSTINPEQAMYYMAAPDGTNKKVVQEGDKYFCEATQKTHDSFIRRYVMRSEVMDHTGRLIVNVFNDQAEQILGCTADELAAAKEKGTAFDSILRDAALGEPFTFRIMCKPEEYNGQTRLRYAVQNLKPVDYVQQSAWLAAEIGKMIPVKSE